MSDFCSNSKPSISNLHRILSSVTVSSEGVDIVMVIDNASDSTLGIVIVKNQLSSNKKAKHFSLPLRQLMAGVGDNCQHS
jgi:hypothetical protein